MMALRPTRTPRWALALSVLLVLTLDARGAETPALPEDDREGIEALALYPTELRDAVLEASLYPKTIDEISALQRRTSEDFRQRLEDLPREDQARVWELVRYPAVIDAIVASRGDRGRSDRDLRDAIQALEDVPEKIRSSALETAGEQTGLIGDISEIRRSAEAELDRIVAKHPLSVQASFRRLVEQPETLALLAEKPDLTAQVGRAFRADPDGTRQQLDSIGAELSEQYEEALEEWRRGLEEDPEVAEEARQAALDFAEAEGLDPTDLPPAEDEDSAEGSAAQDSYHHHHHHYYPYWYGYPYWYPYAYWRPVPFWVHSGFYFGPHRNVIVVGFPSLAFSYWSFHVGFHYATYPRFASYHVRHVRHANLHVRPGGHRVVRDWVRNNRGHLPQGYFNADRRLPDRMRELGKFERDFAKHGGKLSRENFLAANRDRFETLDRSRATPALNEPRGAPDRARRESPSRGADAESQRDRRTSRDRSAEQTHRQQRDSREARRGRAHDTMRRERAPDHHRGSWRGSGGGSRRGGGAAGRSPSGGGRPGSKHGGGSRGRH